MRVSVGTLHAGYGFYYLWMRKNDSHGAASLALALLEPLRIIPRINNKPHRSMPNLNVTVRTADQSKKPKSMSQKTCPIMN